MSPPHPRARHAEQAAGASRRRPLRYLELGFGQGLSLNIHAAAYDGEYWGTDFNPTQAGNARELAAASGANVNVFDASFAELAPPRRPAGIRRHCAARHLELDLGREPARDRRHRPAQARGRRRPLCELQHDAGLERGDAAQAPDVVACRSGLGRGAGHGAAHRPGARLRPERGRFERALFPRQSAGCRAAQGHQGPEQELSRPRILQCRLASHAVLGRGQLPRARQALFCGVVESHRPYRRVVPHGGSAEAPRLDRSPGLARVGARLLRQPAIPPRHLRQGSADAHHVAAARDVQEHALCHDDAGHRDSAQDQRRGGRGQSAGRRLPADHGSPGGRGM